MTAAVDVPVTRRAEEPVPAIPVPAMPVPAIPVPAIPVSAIPYAAVFRSLREPAFVTDAEGRLVVVNPAATRLFGRPDEAELARIGAELDGRAEWEGAVVFAAAPGGARTVCCRASRLCDDSGRPAGFVVVGDEDGAAPPDTAAASLLPWPHSGGAQGTGADLPDRPDAFVPVDDAGCVTDWNAEAEEMFGWRRDEAVGRSFAELVLAPADREAFTSPAGHGTGGPSQYRMEPRAVRRDGTVFPAELVVWSAGGVAGGQVALLRDISDRRRTEQASRSRAGRQDAIVAAQLDVAQVELTPSTVMQLVCDRTVELTGADAAQIELREGEELVVHAVAGEGTPVLGSRLPLVGTLSGLALAAGESLVCADAASDPRTVAEPQRPGVRAMLVTPLSHGGRTVGVLKAYSPQPGWFGAEDLGALDLLAAPFATAMFNAWNLERTSQRASTDRLTGLANRAQVLKELDRAIARQARSGGHTAVVFIDLDGFKQVNDTLGHAAGDELLTAVAGRLRQAVRTTDTPGRYGGDEFIVVCDQMTSAEDALVLADRLVDTVAGHYPLPTGLVTVGASIGLAVALAPVPAAAMLRAADEAMYEAKRAGGSGYRIRDLTAAVAAASGWPGGSPDEA